MIRTCCFLVMALIGVNAMCAGLKPADIFDNNMVLQRDMAVPIWGTAGPASKVTVTFAGQSKETVADDKGTWLIKLDPMKASAEGRTLEIKASKDDKVEAKDFQNVLVGEVWFCSGQSNMAMQVKQVKNSAEEIKQASWPLIRHNSGKGWTICSPKTVAAFSATAYFFGRELAKELNIPVGLINRSVGGTPIEFWTPEKDLLVSEYAKNLFEKCNQPGTAKAFDEYQKQQRQFKADQQKWIAENRKSKGKNPNPKPVPPKAPENFFEASVYRKGSISNLFNRLVKPVIPYAIRGFIWYQGERNSRFAEGSYQYRNLLPIMIQSWRKLWNEGDIPFFFVQLPNYNNNTWPLIRESMLKSLSVKNTGMAVTIDIGDNKNIHPTNKQDVGKRLALLALKKVYGKEIVAESPFFDKMTVDGNKATLSFKNAGSGLKAKGDTLLEFEIAGDDKTFYPARAEIKDNQVVVSSKDVKVPVAVRYGWKATPKCNLYNNEGLPASPFRTDEWEQ